MSCELCKGHWRYLGIIRSKDGDLFALVCKYVAKIFGCQQCYSAININEFKVQLQTELFSIRESSMLSTNNYWQNFNIDRLEKEKATYDRFANASMKLNEIQTYDEMVDFVQTLGETPDKQQKKSATITKLRNKLAKTIQKKKNLQEDIATLNREIVVLTTNKSMIQEELVRQIQQNNDIFNENTGFKNTISTLEKQNIQAITERDNSRQSLEASEKLVHVVAADREDTYSKLIDREEDCASLKMQVDLLTGQLSEHRTASNRTEAANVYNMSELRNQHRDQIAMMVEERDSMRVMINEKQKEIDNLNSTLSAVRKSIM